MVPEVPMQTSRSLLVVMSVVLAGACGADDGAPRSTDVVPSTSLAPSITTSESSIPPTSIAEDRIVVVWPAADIVFDTPDEAAADFVRAVFGVEPVLGPFQEGDSRSGEIEVLPPLEASGGDVRSLLLLRQFGPNNGWFVTGASSGSASIDQPGVGDAVAAGSLQVIGRGTGFEATLVARAFEAGDADDDLDRQVVMAGNLGDTLPYATTLDLSGARDGEIVVVLVSSGVGLETDTGYFSAVPVVVAGR
jgi:hypothetical protein